MPAQGLLIAGPFALDDIGESKGLIGGAGAYAAIAAAPLTPTQLWTRIGKDLEHQPRSLLVRRHIDLDGCGDEKPTSRWRSSDNVFTAGGNALPIIAPTTAEAVGAIALIKLPPADGRRALSIIAALPGADQRTLIVVPDPADCQADANYLRDCATPATLLIMAAHHAVACTGTADPLAAAQALQKHGAKAVVLTAGMFGGLIAYRNKVCTFPAMPVAVTEPTGVGSTFAGVLAAWLAQDGNADFRSVKRGVAMASAVAGACATGVGPKKLLSLDRKEYFERFNKLRRLAKF